MTKIKMVSCVVVMMMGMGMGAGCAASQKTEAKGAAPRPIAQTGGANVAVPVTIEQLVPYGVLGLIGLAITLVAKGAMAGARKTTCALVELVKDAHQTLEDVVKLGWRRGHNGEKQRKR